MLNVSVRAAVALLVLTVGCGNSGGAKNPGDPSMTPGKGPTSLPSVPGKPDTSVKTALPPIGSFANVTASAVGDSVAISVAPVQGAKDYRVYELPADSDVMVGGDGFVNVTNATYRCAGDRQAPGVATDNQDLGQSEAVRTQVEDVDVKGYKRSLAEASLGFVYVNGGDGRVPVYALGSPLENGDNFCYFERWNESRLKRYTTSEDERDKLLNDGWRDDGIVFYAAADGADDTKPLYTSGSEDVFYFVDGPEKAARDGASVAFQIANTMTADDSVALMRVYYENRCGWGHDELTPGVARFERARFQGDKQPLFDLHWSGITKETTLVVEALDVGCPFGGVLTAAAKDAAEEDGVPYPAFLTVDDARAASPTGEVFINGQHEATNKPKALARSFIKISPGPKPEMDWFTGFGADDTAVPAYDADTFNEPCENPDNKNCLSEYRNVSDFGDLTFTSATQNRNTIGVVGGELWVTYADVGADVGGHFRFTPPVKATMSADTFLHVTMEVDAFSTARRYPQMFISDAEAPVQWRFPQSNTLLIQGFPDNYTANWPYLAVVEVCDHRAWEVNDQCPIARPNIHLENGKKRTTPGPEFYEHTGVDRSTKLDAFVSTKRTYLFVDGLAYGCVNLPSSGIPSGSVTVTFGDVIYHSGVDAVFSFHKEHQQIVARRHFDNLGFKSAAPAPLWDEARHPCLDASEFVK